MCVELVYARLDISVSLYAGIYHTFGADLRSLHKFSQCIQLLAGIARSAFCTDTTYISGIIEYGETVSLHYIHQFYELHAETKVGLVTAIVFHGICPWHAQKRFRQFHTADFLEQVFGHAFEEVDDIILFNERHLTVYLREFRLTVGTQVFVTETFGNLEVTVETGYHQQLLQRLRALRQSIELSRIHARRNYEVAGAFRSRTYQDRSFHFNETLAVQILTHFDRHFVAKLQVTAYIGTAQVQVAVLHADVVAAVRILLDGERRSQCSIQDTQFRYDDLDVTGRYIAVFAETFVHCAFYLNYEFTSQAVGALAKVGIHFFVEY